jgi:hypothetical protein
VLVTGENPDKKKVVKAHEWQVKIITIKQMNGLILGDFTLEDLTTDDYPEAAIAVLDAMKIQVQLIPNHQSNMSRPRMALPGSVSQDKKMMLCQQELATAMVRGTAHTIGAAARGVNANNSIAVGGDGTIKITIVAAAIGLIVAFHVF